MSLPPYSISSISSPSPKGGEVQHTIINSISSTSTWNRIQKSFIRFGCLTLPKMGGLLSGFMGQRCSLCALGEEK
jgi:hypothetical protein